MVDIGLIGAQLVELYKLGEKLNRHICLSYITLNFCLNIFFYPFIYLFIYVKAKTQKLDQKMCLLVTF